MKYSRAHAWAQAGAADGSLPERMAALTEGIFAIAMALLELKSGP